MTYRHRVYFTRDVFSPTNPLLKELLTQREPERCHQALVTLDEALGTARPGLARQIEDYFARFASALKLACPPLLIEGGERAKNSFFHVTQVHSCIERYGLCRHSYVIAIGGGAHLDVVGLAAATAHRGMRLVRIPTTTLAQDDSGVGVKNGINAFGKKNFIGVFAPPFAVINDAEFLLSLPPRDKRAGYVEALKVALIRDRAFFEELEQHAKRLRAFEPEAMAWLIRRSAELHVHHIATSGDPFELGSARPLDFGHWAAHKLEELSEYNLRHGEAVAIGVALDTLYSQAAGLLAPAAATRVLRLLERLGFTLFADELLHRDAAGQYLLLGGLREFREHLGGELTITLLAELGQGVEVHQMNPAWVLEAIQELVRRQRQAGPVEAAHAL